MQATAAASRSQGQQQTSVKIYNAVYSSVQVYECMVRGIAVMRRRTDSYVNATQILKVAGVDKGRRTKILEKEILPGKHEIVQGGYGKYQGTWIPLERGRELAVQYGIGPLLAPLFDFTPTQQGMGGLPNPIPTFATLTGSRPLSASASFPNIGTPTSHHSSFTTGQYNGAPIMPGSALRLLNQGRAQGLFTPSSSALTAASLGIPGTAQPTTAYYHGLLPPFSAPNQPSQEPTGTAPSLKRMRTESDIDAVRISAATPNGEALASSETLQPSSMDASAAPMSVVTQDIQMNGVNEPSPSKRARTDPLPPTTELQLASQIQAAIQSMSRTQSATPQPQKNGISRTGSSSSLVSNSKAINGADSSSHSIRLSTRPPYLDNVEKLDPLKDPGRGAIMAAICQGDNSALVLNMIREASGANQYVDWDMIIDDLGHTPLHLAASLARLETVRALVANGADTIRGNYQGETPLIRSVLSTHNCDDQSFFPLLQVLHSSIWAIDTAKRSVLHHAALTAGVKGRSPFARYYLHSVLSWIATHESADFKSIIDLQDEHGDTALNIAARIGNRGLVRALLDVGANRILPNNLGLRPGDFGVEPDEFVSVPKGEDLVTALRAGPTIPIQKSQDVIADLTSMIKQLSADFSAEIKSKQDAFDVANRHVRAATRELAEQRRQIEHWRLKKEELEQAAQRLRNVTKALAAENDVDWTGRLDAAGVPVPVSVDPAFAFRGAQSTLTGSNNVDLAPPEDPPLAAENSLQGLIVMRRMKLFQDRIENCLEERLQGLFGSSAEKEYHCKKIVALCTGISVDKIDEKLDDLLIAVESESQIIDIGRVSGFMQRVQQMSR